MKREPLIISLLPVIIITLLSVFLLANWSFSEIFLAPPVAEVPGLFFAGTLVFGFVLLALIFILVSYYVKHG